MLLWSGGLIAGFFGVVKGGDALFSAAGYKGPASDHFDGKVFRNIDPFQPRGFRDFIRWQMNRAPGKWEELNHDGPGTVPPKRVMSGGMCVTYINHATALIQIDGRNILTDPIWSERAGPTGWTGPRRKRAPGVRFEDLPPIDTVIISHNHYDHLDIPTLKRLKEAHDPVFISGLGNGSFLKSKRIDKTVELDWWENYEAAPDIKIIAVPSRHFSGRGLSDRDNTLWCGFVIQSTGGNIYFAGDTGFGTHFEEIARRVSPIRLALLPIGAYMPSWFMSPVHISPEEALAAHRVLKADMSMAMHFGTFALGDDGEDRPIEDLKSASGKIKGPSPRFIVPEFGEVIDVPLIITSRPGS